MPHYSILITQRRSLTTALITYLDRSKDMLEH